MWDQICYEAYFDRRLSALGLKLLEATEGLLDPEGHGLTVEEASKEAQHVVDMVRNGYGYGDV